MDAPLPAGPTPLGELTRRMAQGNDEAWIEFHREYGPRIFRHLLACTRGDHALATEALQGAYLRVARHVRFCDNEDQWLAWLCRVARCELSDLRRRHSRFLGMLRRRFFEPEPVDAEPEGFLLDAVESCLARLDADVRALLEAKYLRSLRVDAIAESLGLSAKTVESRLTRARAELRELVEQTLRERRP